MATTDWHALAAEVDVTVDDNLGEPIEFTAWRSASDYEAGGPDPDRIIPNAVGCYVNRNARVMPVLGMPPKAAPAANIDLLFSIRDLYIANVQEKDRVYLPDRNFRGEIAYIEPGDTDRSILFLLRVKE